MFPVKLAAEKMQSRQVSQMKTIWKKEEENLTAKNCKPVDLQFESSKIKMPRHLQ